MAVHAVHAAHAGGHAALDGVERVHLAVATIHVEQVLVWVQVQPRLEVQRRGEGVFVHGDGRVSAHEVGVHIAPVRRDVPAPIVSGECSSEYGSGFE